MMDTKRSYMRLQRCRLAANALLVAALCSNDTLTQAPSSVPGEREQLSHPMAKSLKCNQCNTLLKSVAEAQSHSEATGHVDFAETEEVVRTRRMRTCPIAR
jgi:hypothetical protein